MSVTRLGSETVYPEPQPGLKTNPAATLFLPFRDKGDAEKKKKNIEKQNVDYAEHKYKCALKTRPPPPTDN